MEIEWSLLASRQLNDVLDFVETEYGSITFWQLIDSKFNGLDIKRYRFIIYDCYIIITNRFEMKAIFS